LPEHERACKRARADAYLKNGSGSSGEQRDTDLMMVRECAQGMSELDCGGEKREGDDEDAGAKLSVLSPL
jgi:hypothetical protein